MMVVIQKLILAKEISIETYAMNLICSRQRLKAKRERSAQLDRRMDDAIAVRINLKSGG